jgi:hypothetical protein
MLKNSLSKTTSVIAIFALVLNFFSAAIAVAEPAPPKEISNCQQLQAINNDLTDNYVVTTDFSCAADTHTEGGALWNDGLGFDPIGYTAGTDFTGTFDGQDHIIDGLYMNRPEYTGIGLFQGANSGTIQNISLTHVDITGGGTAGSLVGVNASTISNVNVDAAINSVNVGGMCSGGLVGENYGTITNSSAIGTITSANNEVGGFVGCNYADDENAGSIDNSYANVAVTSSTPDSYEFGGFAGANYGGFITNSRAYGDVTVTAENSGSVGGFIGLIEQGSGVSSDYATGTVTGITEVGGFAGIINGDAEFSIATGKVTGSTDVGGFVGSGDGSIYQSYATGAVEGTEMNAGGFAGTFVGDITDTYATGSVTGNMQVGGFAGDIESGSITNSYSTGYVTGTSEVGGFLGMGGGGNDYITNDFSVSDIAPADLVGAIGGFIGYPMVADYSSNYWYTDTIESGIGDSVIVEPIKAESKGYFKNTSTAAPFDGNWDFSNVWKTNIADYPTLLGMPEMVSAPVVVTDDTTPPTFSGLPNATAVINVTEGQLITTNPYVIQVHPTDENGISKVEFYIDDILICTATTPDSNGVYSCSWDTSKYHSQIKVYAYDTNDNQSVVLQRNTTVSLTATPNTGLQPASYIPATITVVAGIGLILVAKRRYS